MSSACTGSRSKLEVTATGSQPDDLTRDDREVDPHGVKVLDSGGKVVSVPALVSRFRKSECCAGSPETSCSESTEVETTCHRDSGESGAATAPAPCGSDGAPDAGKLASEFSLKDIDSVDSDSGSETDVREATAVSTVPTTYDSQAEGQMTVDNERHHNSGSVAGGLGTGQLERPESKRSRRETILQTSSFLVLLRDLGKRGPLKEAGSEVCHGRHIFIAYSSLLPGSRTLCLSSPHFFPSRWQFGAWVRRPLRPWFEAFFLLRRLVVVLVAVFVPSVLAHAIAVLLLLLFLVIQLTLHPYTIWHSNLLGSVFLTSLVAIAAFEMPGASNSSESTLELEVCVLIAFFAPLVTFVVVWLKLYM